MSHVFNTRKFFLRGQMQVTQLPVSSLQSLIWKRSVYQIHPAS